MATYVVDVRQRLNFSQGPTSVKPQVRQTLTFEQTAASSIKIKRTRQSFMFQQSAQHNYIVANVRQSLSFSQTVRDDGSVISNPIKINQTLFFTDRVASQVSYNRDVRQTLTFTQFVTVWTDYVLINGQRVRAIDAYYPRNST